MKTSPRKRMEMKKGSTPEDYKNSGKVSPRKYRRVLHGAKNGGNTNSQIDILTSGYMKAILFSENDDEDNPLESNYNMKDFAPETVTAIEKMMKEFVSENKKAIQDSEMPYEQIGRDIWFTQKGHGVGFFDRGLDKDIEKQLTNSAKAMVRFPEIEIDSNNKIHVHGVEKYKQGGSTMETVGERGAIERASNVIILANFSDNNDKLSQEKDAIYDMADTMQWDIPRLHQQFKRIFSYMAEVAYNKENPDNTIEMTEEERNEFASEMSQEFNPHIEENAEHHGEPNISEAKKHLAEAIEELQAADQESSAIDQSIDSANRHIEFATDELEGNPLPFAEGGKIKAGDDFEYSGNIKELKGRKDLKLGEIHKDNEHAFVLDPEKNYLGYMRDSKGNYIHVNLSHIRKTKDGGKFSINSKNKALSDKISKLEKALANGKLSATAKKSMQQKLDKYKHDLNRRIPVSERVSMSKGKFYIEIPSEYRAKMTTLLWNSNLKPRYIEYDGKLRITVDNKAKLHRLYKIYSDMLSKKSLPVPSLQQISGKPNKVKRQK